jgi:ribosomal protein S18 acetylase RimI-like enzyme
MEELIRRSEVIERAAWRDLYRRAPRQLRHQLGLQITERAGATILSATRVDHLLLNRAIGVQASPAAVRQAVRHFERRSIRRFWIHMGSDLRYSPLPTLLRERGITPYPRSWMKFVRRVGPLDQAKCGLTIRPARQQDGPRVGSILASGFDMPKEVGALLAEGVGLAGWGYFLAEEDGQILAASATYTQGDDGYLAFAATMPEARRRGCQRALMAARLAHAQSLGCRQVFTETGMPVEGEPSSSYRNILRGGFDELQVRDNFAPEGTRWHKLPSSDAIARSVVSPKPSRTWLKGTARSGS